ncbi:hypothetical protein [Vreelandella nigrificans]|uniref:Uncharacterized protein n=1 Tax=Vreelandella nigrificans TaxID=2042704 RepID=A0A2A4HLX1_9GAMM|nr:hypothetical protein [Halomonas nigrificans]PCF96348.1 hypothetical protein CPA45_07385 [Halomonas nigrificans]
MKRPFEWVDVMNPEQFNWIANYLTRKTIVDLLPYKLGKNLQQFGPQATISILSSFPETTVYRELSHRMQTAWNVRKHRKKHGNPVSIQMSKETQRQLKALAKKSGQSQVETLSQVISNAVHEQEKETEKYKKEKESFSFKLEEQKKKAHQNRYVLSEAVKALQKALSEEIDHRCRYEALVGKLDNAVIESDAIEAYCVSVTKRVAEVELELGILKIMRARVGPSLNERMQEFIRFHEGRHFEDGSGHS